MGNNNNTTIIMDPLRNKDMWLYDRIVDIRDTVRFKFCAKGGPRTNDIPQSLVVYFSTREWITNTPICKPMYLHIDECNPIIRPLRHTKQNDPR